MTLSMLPNVYSVPNVVRVEVEFRDSEGVLTDPAAVVMKYRTPTTGTVTTLTYGVDGALVKDGVGLYHVNVTVSVYGDWFYAFLGDSAKLESWFRVRPSVLA